MKRNVKRKKALEDVVASITGTRKKEAQKSVVVAYVDGDVGGNMRGLPPHHGQHVPVENDIICECRVRE